MRSPKGRIFSCRGADYSGLVTGAARSSEMSRPEASPYSRHIPALDGVRGLAIAMVMASHLFPGTPHNLAQRFVFDVLGFGASGVDLFFVLSGFLITGILFDSRHDPGYFRKFYARRALRIFPLYYGVLAGFALVGLWQHRSSGRELLSLALYLQNTSLLARPIWEYGGALSLPLAHFWSLAVEEQFYLLWPLLVFLLRSRVRLLGLCMAAILLCPLLRYALWMSGFTYTAVNAATYCRADALLIGGALALLLRSRKHRWTLSWSPWLVLALVPVLCLRFVNSASGSNGAATTPAALAALALNYSVLACGYGGLLSCSLVPGSFANRAFAMRPLRALGRYSYGLYVLHLIVLFFWMAPLRSAVERLSLQRALTGTLTGLLVFAASLVAAILSYQLYERHFLKLKRFFEYRGSRAADNPVRGSAFRELAPFSYHPSLPGDVSASAPRV